MMCALEVWLGCPVVLLPVYFLQQGFEHIEEHVNVDSRIETAT